MAIFLPPLFTAPRALQDAQDAVVEMREHDVPYHVRFAIDTDTRCGHWFTVRAKVGGKGMLWWGQGDTVVGSGGCAPASGMRKCHGEGGEQGWR